MSQIVDINKLDDEKYEILRKGLPHYVVMSVSEEFDNLIFAMPANIGKVTSMADLIEHTLYMYGNGDCIIDYEDIAVIAGTREKLLKNFENALHPEESVNRVMNDLVAALSAISRKIIAALDEVKIPIVTDVGAVYRYHSIKAGQLALKLLDYETLKDIAASNG